MGYESENEALLYDILNDAFYRSFRNEAYYRNSEATCLELNLTADCNQKCEYCYLAKRGDELYPKSIRRPDTILRNIRILFDYLISESMVIRSLDLFSGEIWGSAFGNDVFDVILTYIDRGLGVKSILIPSNMSFILDTGKYAKVKEYIQKFKDVNCRLSFSASIDGLYLEESERSFVAEHENKKRDQVFYDELFRLCKKEKYAFHPMVAAHGIGNWVRNFDWWQEMFRKYGLNPFEYGMYLEVRNDEWTMESVAEYLRFVDHMVDYDLYELMQGDLTAFAKDVFSNQTMNRVRGYFPYIFTNTGCSFDCSVNSALIVRCGDLAIGPCHRTCYDPFLYGKYRVEDGKITGLDANNVQLAQLILNQTFHSVMGCEKCPIAYFCNRGCLGAQYEASGEILKPCESVCMMMKARVIYLYVKYTRIGLFEAGETCGDPSILVFVAHIKDKLMQLKKGEPNLWNYWEHMATEILSGR